MLIIIIVLIFINRIRNPRRVSWDWTQSSNSTGGKGMINIRFKILKRKKNVRQNFPCARPFVVFFCLLFLFHHLDLLAFLSFSFCFFSLLSDRLSYSPYFISLFFVHPLTSTIPLPTFLSPFFFSFSSSLVCQ